MLITAARGLKIDCGCGLFFRRQVGLAPILEDGLIFLWAVGLYYGELTAAGEVPATASRRQINDSKLDMASFFNFYDPLEKRYIFNSFLVVVALVEILILVFTLIWQIDFEGIFGTPIGTPTPFPWKPYLLASFIAPIALLFLFGLIIQGFEILCQDAGDLRRQGAPGWAGSVTSWACWSSWWSWFFWSKGKPPLA